jgi:predicted metal-dependent HD superfamily phosphohydrolase
MTETGCSNFYIKILIVARVSCQSWNFLCPICIIGTVQKISLKSYFEKDKRLEKLFLSAKEVYDSKNLPNHNFNHIAQVLYRALLIAESDKLDFNPSILISACTLHDIGYSIVQKKEGHEEAGSEISTQLLQAASFTEEEIEKILDAIINYRVPGKSIEVDILYDADVLNQAGFGSMYYFFVSLYEYQQFPDGKEEKYHLDNFLNSRLQIVEQLKKEGLRTDCGNKLLRNGFEERKQFIEESLHGIEERSDFLITPEDLLA